MKSIMKVKEEYFIRTGTGRRRGAVFRNSNEEDEYNKNAGKRRISKPT